MQHLDLYKPRPHNVITLADGTAYKIPKEYTVEEVERLLELKVEEEELQAQAVSKKKDEKKAQLDAFWNNVFYQIETIFKAFQPDIDQKYLKKHVTHNEALEIIGFFQKYRTLALKAALETQIEKSEAKKKDNPSLELRELRRVIIFMVSSGFSLFELRKLYIDELYDYYQELFYTLEFMGKAKEGSYDKIVNRKKGVKVEDTVNELRKQIFRSITPKKKHG